MEMEVILQQNLMIMMWSPVKSKCTEIAHSDTNEILQSLINRKDENDFQPGRRETFNFFVIIQIMFSAFNLHRIFMGKTFNLYVCVYVCIYKYIYKINLNVHCRVQTFKVRMSFRLKWLYCCWVSAILQWHSAGMRFTSVQRASIKPKYHVSPT